MMKNLFDYATKELSQDAFLRWLFENYNCENESVKNAFRKLFDSFTNNSDEFKDKTITELKTVSQWKNIDISVWFTVEEKDYLIVIEDKTRSDEHHQLTTYNEKIAKHCKWLIDNKKRPIKNVYKIFYKTSKISNDERDRISAAGWDEPKIFDIYEIYELFKDCQNSGSEILDGYAQHIRDIYDYYENYMELDFKEDWLWNNTAFEAYATKLKQELEKGDFNVNVDCYRGMYVYMGVRRNFGRFTTELLFEFRHWEIVAKIIYWTNNNNELSQAELKKHMRDINLPINDDEKAIFKSGTAYGSKRLAQSLKLPDSDTPDNKFFETRNEFIEWVYQCIKEYEEILSKISIH